MEHTTFLPEATSGQQRYAYHRWNILFEAHTGLVFLLLWAVYAAMTFVQQEFIFTDAVYYNSLGEQLTHERIEILLELRSRWGWISYFFIPVTILFQAFFVTICLNIGTLLSENPIYRAVTFKSLFGLVLKSSVVHVAYPLLLLLFAFSMIIECLCLFIH